MPASDEISIGYYLVALIDVLNQKDALRNLKALPTSPEEHSQFIDVLKRTYGTVEGFRSLFDTFFKAFLEDRSEQFPLTPQQRTAFRELRQTPLKTQMFADTVILYVPLRDDTAKVPMNGVHAVLLACGATFLAMLAGRHACRGGIDVGVAFEPHEGEIYGPALLRAYELERSVAQYPRIVIGQTLITYLTEKTIAQGNTISAQITRELAKGCLGLVAHDVDGQPFLDVLGKGFDRAMGGSAHTELVQKAVEFVGEQVRQAQEKKDSKLAFRYALLRQYFEARLSPPRAPVDPHPQSAG